ncbi:MAG: citrate synthase, partial [Firmicutes bacterium]|nr:citrate synthase [Bacillota bacterium]
EKLTPVAYADVKGYEKTMCSNVDMYSGLVYRMLNIPDEMYTPLFATARISGWMAHRIEEVATGGKIIRPAYKPIHKKIEYVSMSDR